MTLTQVGGALVIFLICPILGGLPLIQWTSYILSRQRLDQLGTGNVSVSAAFYHAGRWAGVVAVGSEALKGVLAVVLARHFFPDDPVWEVVALIALVMGRYWIGKGAGTTNVVWGFAVHDPVVAGLVCLIGGISFTVLRERRQARFGVLMLLALITALLHPSASDRILATVLLSGLLGWIYSKIPDDLELNPQAAQAGSQSMFQFFRGDRAIRTLDHPLAVQKFGQKAATLASLKRLGYPVPMGWMIAPGDDPAPLTELLTPSPKHPLVVRSSAVGEDSDSTSAAGQYESVLGITSRDALPSAITRCFASYNQSAAIQYRRDLNVPDSPMAVLVQQQIRGVFSGVAFSRDPILRQGDAVVIEALAGNANRVVSGRVTPERYRVEVREAIAPGAPPSRVGWILPEGMDLPVDGTGEVPRHLIQQVAYLARHLEAHFQGVPQDIEWSYDGQALWLLQARPVTTLLPIWTRKIASEVIPGVICPLTWSINRPLTCGVWGKLFMLVLGRRSRGLAFTETATLHHSRAYFNASLLGQIFRRMGLPSESLEFLTQGAPFNRPPWTATLRNVPGLLRLWKRERMLERDFQRDDRHRFTPALADFGYRAAEDLSVGALWSRIEQILELLKPATYYSILAPLSAALRNTLNQVSDDQLDHRATPEIAALRSLQELALAARRLLEQQSEFSALKAKQDHSHSATDYSKLFSALAQSPEGQAILTQLDQRIQYYGYLSEVGTDIAIPTWKENPQPAQNAFAQFCIQPPPVPTVRGAATRKVRRLQRRFDLKGRVTEVYSRLLAELRWSILAVAQHGVNDGTLKEAGDIFFLELAEMRQLLGNELEISGKAENSLDRCRQQIVERKAEWERDRQITTVPFLTYGNQPPTLVLPPTARSAQRLEGIGASPGQAEGRIRIVKSLEGLPDIGRETIVVVPYTDSGWAPLLARAGGLIAEVGGRLSHGAIVAREYRLPAVMNVHNAMQLLKDGQQVRIDGQQGTIDIQE